MTRPDTRYARSGDVHIAYQVFGGGDLDAHVSELAGRGEVLVSRTVKDLAAGSGIRFTDRGSHEFKGLDDAWQLRAVDSTSDRGR
jgi:hypothetical protein